MSSAGPLDRAETGSALLSGQTQTDKQTTHSTGQSCGSSGGGLTLQSSLAAPSTRATGRAMADEHDDKWAHRFVWAGSESLHLHLLPRLALPVCTCKRPLQCRASLPACIFSLAFRHLAGTRVRSRAGEKDETVRLRLRDTQLGRDTSLQNGGNGCDADAARTTLLQACCHFGEAKIHGHTLGCTSRGQALKLCWSWHEGANEM